MAPRVKPLEERFWPKVDKLGPGGCWLWTASTDRYGYGRIHVGTSRADSKLKAAHNVAYELLIGPIPVGLELDHLCRITACVNPAHLEPVTHRENLLRSDSVSGKAARVTHCPQGHLYDKQNTRVTNGVRQCRACDREYQRLRRRKKS